MPPDFGKLLITSNCDTSETSIIPAMPRFVTKDDGSVELDVTFDGVSDEEASSMSFLETSAYKAFWSWSGGFNQFFPGPQTIQPTEIINTSGGKCEMGVAADPNNSPENNCNTGEYCYLKEGVCNDKSGIHSGYCQIKPDMCAEIYEPVCGCDGNDYGNACKASSAGVSVSRSGTCEGSATAEPLPVISEVKCEVGFAADPDNNCKGEGEYCHLETGVCTEKSGIHNGYCLVKPDMCAEIYQPVCGCDGEDYGNACAASSAGISVSRSGTCVDDTTIEVIEKLPVEDCPEGECINPETNTCEAEVQCVADPCEVGSCAEGEVCSANYCGGCNTICSASLPATLNGDNPASSNIEEVCGVGEACSEVGASCTAGEETCCGVTHPSLQCDCMDSPNGGLEYMCRSTDMCLYPSCCQEPPPQGMPAASEGTCDNMGQLCDTGIDEDYCCLDLSGGSASYCTKSGGKSEETTTSEATTTSSFTTTTTTTSTEMIEETSTESTTTEALIEESSSPSSSSTPIKEDTDETTTDATVADIISTTTTFAAIDGDFPTKSPTSNVEDSGAPTPSPNWWDGVQDSDTDHSSAFNLTFRMTTAIFAIVIITILYPNNENNHLLGLGKFAVGVIAISSLYPKRSTSKVGGIRKNEQHRHLQETCTFNVEILINSCSKSVEINAHAARAIDVVVENNTQEILENNVVNYEAMLTFPATESTEVLNLEQNNTVNAFDQWEGACLKAVMGRPYIDSTDTSLHAMPLIGVDETKLSWSNEALLSTQAPQMSNATSHHFLLGEDWTNRALGEHSSVASFSAFSIALMSNQAPSELVEDSLKAGLDEIKHTKQSFDIVSRLTGKIIGPGPLPPSTHEFNHDIKKLALAVAKEGCVDETLSAFAAALEVDHITAVIDHGVQDSLYSDIDHETLTFIKEQLVIIAIDESNHSALGWRTIQWICSIDADACDAVQREVFEESKLEMRFQYRAEGSFGETSNVLDSMREMWMKIYAAHQSAQDISSCEEVDTINDTEDYSLLTTVTDNVIHQLA